MRRKNILKFILYQVIFLAITTPLLVFRGPFKNVKNTVVGSIMATRHQYLATIFLTKNEVDKILQNSINSSSSDTQNQNEITIKKNNSKEIQRYEIHTTRIDGYILEISDPLSIKVGLTKKIGKVGQRTSEIVQQNGGIAGINGGAFYDKSPDGKLYAGTGAFPGGIVMIDGNIVYKDIKENQKIDVTGFTKDGVMIIGDYTIEELKKLKVQEALSFGGINSKLIVGGKPQIHDDGGQGLNPRTAIGQKKDGTVIFLVIDGRGLIKQGASLREIQDIMLDRGAFNASNLDGGSSTTMYYKDKVINNPSNWDGERTVATAFYVKE